MKNNKQNNEIVDEYEPKKKVHTKRGKEDKKKNTVEDSGRDIDAEKFKKRRDGKKRDKDRYDHEYDG